MESIYIIQFSQQLMSLNWNIIKWTLAPGVNSIPTIARGGPPISQHKHTLGVRRLWKCLSQTNKHYVLRSYIIQTSSVS